MRLRLDEDGAEPPLEEVADPLVPSVEPLRIVAVEALHSGREVAPRRAEDEVVVVVHQAVGVAEPAEADDHEAQHVQEVAPVDVPTEDRLPVDATRHDVVERVGVGDSRQPRHVRAAPPGV